MNGTQRRAEIRDLADQLGLNPLAAPKTNQILHRAAPTVGLTAVKVCAAWRTASGFAHGRYGGSCRQVQTEVATKMTAASTAQPCYERHSAPACGLRLVEA
ncbi:hypothetical protein OG568_53265 (plasmid) [Streptomyces sp. NBC_01450]|uniref:hypothetical protein n=1 Tax=Streptomyces sp. NBC_01450 TaxID=2903871 RepID=UPI002E3266C1|nr:hypothetical protein [Streptomyces sp. NBC_01450]